MDWLFELLASAGGIVKMLVGWWLSKDSEKERLQHELEQAKEGEAVMAAPDRDKRFVLDSLRKHEVD
jgi:hypothetical protein